MNETSNFLKVMSVGVAGIISNPIKFFESYQPKKIWIQKLSPFSAQGVRGDSELCGEEERLEGNWVERAYEI